MWKPPEDEKVEQTSWQPPADEALDQQQPPEPSRMGLGMAFDVASQMAPWNVARNATTEALGEKTAEVGGSLGFPKTGAAIGTAIQMAPDILASTQSPEKLSSLRKPAEDFGRRALGFNKGLIKKAGGVEKANKVAGQMLDEGVITAGASPSTMLDRAEELSKASGKRIGETLSSVDEPLLTTRGLRREVSNQLSPDKKGGEYSRLRGYVADIQRTIKAHAPKSTTVQKLEVEPGGLLKMNKVRQRPPDELSFESAQELKGTLQGPAQFGKLTDGERAEMFRRSYGIVREAIETGLDDAVAKGLIPKERVDQFIRDKAVYGTSEQAINALKDKLAGEAANNIISLRGTMAGMAGAATGDIQKTLGGLGAWEILRRRGDATGASLLNYASKSRGANTLKNSIATQVGSRITRDDERDEAYRKFINRQ